MKSKVEQYAKGDFYVDYPEVKLSKNYLQLKIEAGSIYTGSISVTSVNDLPMKMIVYDDAYLLRFESHSLIGRKGEIVFTFDGTGKKRGSIYEGIIYVIGNGIEKKIPYNIEIVAPFIDINGVALEDMMKFCALAESDWDKALKIFYSDAFEKTLLRKHKEYQVAYRSLKDSLNKNQALEEFLVYIHKKRALTLQVEHDRFQFQYPKMREEHELVLRKNTWGYCCMKVSSDAKFLSVHQTEICSIDFKEDNCILRYSIDPEMLDETKNSAAHIILENTYQKIMVSVVIQKPEDAVRVLVHRNHDNKLKKLEIVGLLHNYLDYRTGLLPLSNFISKTKEALHNLIAFEPNTGVYKLGLLHMNILAGRADVAKEEIRRMEADSDKTMEGKREHCYYLYLKALLSKEARQIVRACEAIEHALLTEKDKLFYFWLLIYLDERYEKDKQWLFSQIEGLFMGGYRSPVLALEICDLINQEPLILKKLSDLEIAAIRFGLKNHYLTKEAEAEFLQLAAREKEFNPQVFSLLCIIYDVEKRPDIIKIMCSLLIKGGKLDHRYHEYYLEGIKCGYKLVGIQENYLRSMDKSRYGIIPNTVLRYFNYKNALTDSEYAYLYANVITNRRQYLEQFEEYLPNMEAFMEEQIVKGNVSDDLMVLYAEFLRPQTVEQYYAASLVNVIFKRKLTVPNDNISAVVISHKELEHEISVPVVNHVAYVDMVTESAVLSLVDKEGNRYVSTIPYKLQKLVDEAAYMDILEQYAGDDIRYLIYQYDALKAYDATSAKEVNIARDLLSFKTVSMETKQQSVYGIIRYYYEHLDMDILRSYLDKMDMQYVSTEQGAEFINYLLTCGLYDRAFLAISHFGYQGVSVEHLNKLVEKMKEISKYAKEEALISVAAYLYRIGQETPGVLGYLVEHYQSGLEDMVKLWKRADGRLSKLEGLEENILCATLYSERWVEDIFTLFAKYVRKKRRGMVIKAFFKRASFAYLVEDIEIPNAFFDALGYQMAEEDLKDDMCYAAMLLFLSRKPRLEEAEIIWIKNRLEYFVKRGILLPFFRSFKKYVNMPKDLFLMTYVVTKDKAGKKIFFQYGIQSGVEKTECNKEARMMEVLPGYYMKEFVLFHGENLLYRMAEENAAHTVIFESEGMKAKGETEEYDNRFEMLNSMLLNQEVGENQMLIDKIDKYLKLVTIVEENLQLVE